MSRRVEGNLEQRLAEAEAENRRLQQALGRQAEVEQAKGILRERLGLEIEEAAGLLRYAARTSRRDVYELASRVVADPATPQPIVVGLARQARWRAVSMREQNEATQERLEDLTTEVEEQVRRLARTAAVPDDDRPLENLTTAELEVRRRRSARNESLYRQVNEAIERASSGLPDRAGGSAEFICECARADCTTRVEVKLDEYEWVRSDSSRFIVAPGHDDPALETVVTRGRDHWVVEKLGDGAAVAEALDPRASSSSPPGV